MLTVNLTIMILKNIASKLVFCASALIMIQCASSQKIDDIQPVAVKQAYYQEWVAGIKEGGTGINLYIPLANEKSDINLEYAYFKGHKIQLNKKPNENVYVGKHQNEDQRDLIMSENSKDEYANKVPEKVKIPFDLEGDQCVIAYSKEGKEGFFKIEKLTKKQMEAYPMQMKQ